jgi:hypothetical protein
MGAPGFGPFRWSPRPLRGAPLAAWDAASPVRSGGGGGGGTGPPMLSPFFRLPAPSPSPPVTDFGEFSPTMPLFEVGSSSGSGGFPGPSSRMIPGGSSSPFAMGVAGIDFSFFFLAHIFFCIAIMYGIIYLFQLIGWNCSLFFLFFHAQSIPFKVRVAMSNST